MTTAEKIATRASLEALGPYVPALVRERLARDPSPLTTPSIEHFSGAVLFADISGFTPLAEELAQQGEVGAERLKEVLDICFGKLVELAHAFGGDVIKFPGDGVLVLWRARQEVDEDLARAVRLASKCGLQIQENLDGLEGTWRKCW
jgi:class 3 adenylate cyclase